MKTKLEISVEPYANGWKAELRQTFPSHQLIASSLQHHTGAGALRSVLQIIHKEGWALCDTLEIFQAERSQ